MAENVAEPMKQGNCIYDKELMEIVGKLKARGAVLLVVQGNRNKDNVEIGVAASIADMPQLSDALISAGLNLRAQCLEIIAKRFGLADGDYHKKDGGLVN